MICPFQLMDCYLSELFYFITAIIYQQMDSNYLVANSKNISNFAFSSNGRLEYLLLVHWTGKIRCLQLQCCYVEKSSNGAGRGKTCTFPTHCWFIGS